MFEIHKMIYKTEKKLKSTRFYDRKTSSDMNMEFCQKFPEQHKTQKIYFVIRNNLDF